MKWIDIILVIIMLFGAVGGYREGFVMTVLSLVAIILGILGGFLLLGQAMLMLDSNFKINENILPYVAFAIVFVIIVILVSLMGNILRASIHMTFFGSIDRAMGGLLGILKSAFLLSVAFWILDSLGIDVITGWFSSSALYPAISGFAPLVADWLGELIPAFKRIF